jgi:hypothetical protein
MPSALDAFVVTFSDPARLLAAGEPDPRGRHASEVLGEPVIAGLLRALRTMPASTPAVVFRVPRSTLCDDGGAALLAGWRRWCETRRQINRDEVRSIRRIGRYALAVCLVLLAGALLLASLLSSEDPAAAFYGIRAVLSEGAVIAGWVVLWRPLEMILFDPMPQADQNRQLSRLLRMDWRIEPIDDASP